MWVRGAVLRLASVPMQILLGVTGSIAAYKSVELVRLLRKEGCDVHANMTRAGTRFVTPLTFEAVTGHPVAVDVFPSGAQPDIRHIAQAETADLVLIAPASADFLARAAHGLADDALTAALLSTRAPVLVAPAMESGMWANPVTQDNVKRLRARGFRFVGPVDGALASGRCGLGRMAEPAEICQAAMAAHRPLDLQGISLLVTAGPTWESIDPVRVLSNRSTGAMGIEIADAAIARGASVHLVQGPGSRTARPHPSLLSVRVESAQDMLSAVLGCKQPPDVLIAAAAVSDYRPKETHREKLKRGTPAAASLSLVENSDILACASKQFREQGTTLVGFALESEALEHRARTKLVEKGCDLVVGNLVGEGTAFGAKDTEVLAVSRSGVTGFGPASKARVAHFVLDQVARVREQQGGHESEHA